MSSRTTLRPNKVIDAQSLGADIVSDVKLMQSLSRGCFTFSWTGISPIGTVQLEGSNDYKESADGQTVIDAGTWPVFLGSQSVTGNTGVGSIDFETGAYAVRVTYTRTSGTGTLNAYINAKVS